MLIDSHCHIHDQEFYTPEQAEAAYRRAIDEGVSMLCVGTSQPDSRAVVEFAGAHDKVWAIVGVHPHEAKGGVVDIGVLLAEKPPKVVGIGEIGLDYYYDHAPREAQIAALEQQLQWALDYHLPVSFHVREAYDDFWPIFDNFPSVRGVLHSFTDTAEHLEKALARGLYIGVNGISTFTKEAWQQDLFKNIPLECIILETDAPFLTPVPKRGTINEPAFVKYVADYHAMIRGVTASQVAQATTANATTLFAF